MDKLTLIKDMDKLEETLREQIKDVFSEGERIAVKLHMGETNNKYYIKASIIKRIVKVLNGLKLKPFLFDSVVLYRGGRNTAEKYYKTAENHGFTEADMGCPIVISDEGIDVKTKDIVVHVSKDLAEADGILVVSHVKGHICYGFGGAIKNLGMGCVNKKSKADIHRAVNAVTDDLLAQGAQAVLSNFSRGKAFYVNFLINISKYCDCCDRAGPIVAEDIGILLGRDIVAIDKASLDLIGRGRIFKKLHNHDPYLHVGYSKKLGLGEEEYAIS